MSDENQLRYQITPKGLLSAEIGPYDADRVWQSLTDYARRVLDYREDRGVPCIVLEAGGEFIAVRREPVLPPPSTPAAVTPPVASGGSMTEPAQRGTAAADTAPGAPEERPVEEPPVPATKDPPPKRRWALTPDTAAKWLLFFAFLFGAASGMALNLHSEGTFDAERLQRALGHATVLAECTLVAALLSRSDMPTHLRLLAGLWAWATGIGTAYAVVGCACAWWYLHDPAPAGWAQSVAHLLYGGAAAAVTVLPLAFLIAGLCLKRRGDDDSTNHAADTVEPSTAP